MFKTYKIGKMYICKGQNTPRVFSHLDSALSEAKRGRGASTWLYYYPESSKTFYPSPFGENIKHLDGNKPSLLLDKYYYNHNGGYQLLKFLFGTDIGWIILIKDFTEVT